MTTALAVYAALCSTLALWLVLRLARVQSGQGRVVGPPDTGPPLNSPAQRLEVQSVDGVPLVVGEASGDQLLAFFSTTCEGCLSSLPRLLMLVQAAEVPRDRFVAVVIGPASGAERTLLKSLGPVAHLTREADGGPIQAAYNVQLFPSFVRLEDGLVAAKGASANDVLALENATAGDAAGSH